MATNKEQKRKNITNNLQSAPPGKTALELLYHVSLEALDHAHMIRQKKEVLGWRINRRNCYIVAYWTTIFGDDKMSLGEVYELGFIETNSKGQASWIDIIGWRFGFEGLGIGFGDDGSSRIESQLGVPEEVSGIQMPEPSGDTQDMAGTSSYSRRPQVKHSSAQKRSADPRDGTRGCPGPDPYGILRRSVKFC
ncbi:hypothetical protein Tco_1103562 [Tanacetum coccineum]